MLGWLLIGRGGEYLSTRGGLMAAGKMIAGSCGGWGDGMTGTRLELPYCGCYLRSVHDNYDILLYDCYCCHFACICCSTSIATLSAYSPLPVSSLY